MKKRSHENTKRLTAKERTAALRAWCESIPATSVDAASKLFWEAVQDALQAHARETLSRYKLRAAKRGK